MVAVVSLGMLLRARNAPPEPPPRELTAEERARIRALLASGDKIGAIKVHREMTGAGLAASKAAVEALGRG